jgi:hypothetical protein
MVSLNRRDDGDLLTDTFNIAKIFIHTLFPLLTEYTRRCCCYAENILFSVFFSRTDKIQHTSDAE